MPNVELVVERFFEHIKPPPLANEAMSAFRASSPRAQSVEEQRAIRTGLEAAPPASRISFLPRRWSARSFLPGRAEAVFFIALNAALSAEVIAVHHASARVRMR